MTPLTIKAGGPLAKFLFPIPETLCSAGLEVLVSKGSMLLSGDSKMIPLNWNLRLSPSHFWLLLPLESTGEEGS